MASSRRKISALRIVHLRWSLEHLSTWQKMKWSAGFVATAWRRKLGLEMKPMRIWDWHGC